MFNHSGAIVTIRKLLIQESGRYNDMWRRTFKTEYTGDVHSILAERLSGRTNITPGMVAGVASQFITVEAAPETLLNIPQGWRESRFRFMMEVEIVDPLSGTKTLEILSGFSDRIDISRGLGTSQHVNPHLHFNINSIITIMEQVQYGPTGRTVVRNVVDNSHLLYDKNNQGMQSSHRQDFMRPEDIYSLMSLSGVSPHIASNSYDARTMMSQRPVKSSRLNTVTANYMSKTMQGFNSAYVAQQVSPDEVDLFTTAIGNVTEMVAATDPFLSALKGIRGRSHVEGIFTMADLEKLNPGCTGNNQVTRTSLLPEPERVQLDATQSTDSWSDSELETQFATILAQTIPSLMTNMMLLGLEFTATNRATLDRQSTVVISGHQGFSEHVDVSQHLMAIENQIGNQVMRDLSKNGLIDFHVKMRVDIMNEIRIKVQLFQRPEKEFRAPAFCDALFVPIVTGNRDKAMAIAKDFEDMNTNIITGLGGQSQAQALFTGQRASF